MSLIISLSDEALTNLERCTLKLFPKHEYTKYELIDSNIVVLRVILKQFPNSDDIKSIVRGGHFLLLKAAGLTLWKLQRLPIEMVEKILLAIEPTSCYHRLFIQRPEWQYVYYKSDEQSSLLVTEESCMNANCLQA